MATTPLAVKQSWEMVVMTTPSPALHRSGRILVMMITSHPAVNWDKSGERGKGRRVLLSADYSCQVCAWF